jgi:Cu2+-exporting ATPase
MSADAAVLASGVATEDRHGHSRDVISSSRVVGDGLRQIELSVPSIRCGGCIRRIEGALASLPGVAAARVNLSTRRVSVRWRTESSPPPVIATLRALGYDAHPHERAAVDNDETLGSLVRALAVAGFATANIMLLSVSIWSGADPRTRDLFHWLSALIAFPALAYSGQIFFRSAWRSLRRCQTNMDVPISIGVLLAYALSLYETGTHGADAYFDASASLLFFLLIGRTLDYAMRKRARLSVEGLARLASRGATIRRADGTERYLPLAEIEPGMTILLAAGERVPVDARVTAGASEIDGTLATGESLPQPVAPGSLLQAGTLNLTGSLTVVAMAAATDSFLAEITRMMEAAEAGRSAYRRIADRAARLYAPAVHAAALLSFVGWMIATGDLHRALVTGIAVLIITCPCALALAVPMVQIVAAQRLFASGIMVKDGSALERLAEVDHVLFDKTGTLTVGTPRLAASQGTIPETPALALAAAMARHSRHPYARALATAGGAVSAAPPVLDGVKEQAGSGLEAMDGASVYRLGRPEWALAEAERTVSDEAQVVLAKDGRRLAGFSFDERLRPDAAAAVEALLGAGIAVEILSGDRSEPVRRIAARLGIPGAAQSSPQAKASRIAAIAASGGSVLMVGDGLNDGPALVAAHASMAPATAADVGRNAADLVFLRESLWAVPQAIGVARAARRLVRENLAIALAYNAVAVPVAVLGGVTPLIAAAAMSLSSITVIANALRLGRSRAPDGRVRCSTFSF